jgi:hypothetical protein
MRDEPRAYTLSEYRRRRSKFDTNTLDALFPGRIRTRFRRAMIAGHRSLRDEREVPPGSNWVSVALSVFASADSSATSAAAVSCS